MVQWFTNPLKCLGGAKIERKDVMGDQKDVAGGVEELEVDVFGSI